MGAQQALNYTCNTEDGLLQRQTYFMLVLTLNRISDSYI